jgi:hypothetical protein
LDQAVIRVFLESKDLQEFKAVLGKMDLQDHLEAWVQRVKQGFQEHLVNQGPKEKSV